MDNIIAIGVFILAFALMGVMTTYLVKGMLYVILKLTFRRKQPPSNPNTISRILDDQ